jgi:hypothetical protein
MHPYLLSLLLFQEGGVLCHRRIVALCAGNRVERRICDPVLGPRNTNADAHPLRDGLQQEERHLTEKRDGGRSDSRPWPLHRDRAHTHTHNPARGALSDCQNIVYRSRYRRHEAMALAGRCPHRRASAFTTYRQALGHDPCPYIYTDTSYARTYSIPARDQPRRKAKDCRRHRNTPSEPGSPLMRLLSSQGREQPLGSLGRKSEKRWHKSF